MENERIALYKVRDNNQILSVIVEFLRKTGGKLVLSLFCFAFPLILLSSIGKELLSEKISAGRESIFILIILSYTVTIVSLFLVSIITFAILDLYYQEEEAEFNIQDILKKIKDLGPDYLIAYLALLGAIILGYALFIIPGIFASIALSLVLIVRVKEKKSISDSFRRSYYLTKDRWWATFGLFAIIAILNFLITFSIAVPFTIVSAMMGQFSQEAIKANGFGVRFVEVLSDTISKLVYCLTVIAAWYYYGNLVERREGLSLQEQITKAEEQA